MKAIKLETFSRVSKANATEASPAGTIKFHYALEGTDAEIEAYKEAKGQYLREVSEGTHKGKPMWFTSQILDNEVNVKLNADGYLQVVETLATAEEKAVEQKLGRRIANGDALAKIEFAAKMAAKHGTNIAV